MFGSRAARQLAVLVGVAAARPATALPLLELLLASDPDALGAGGIVTARDAHGEALRLEHPALLAGARDAAVLALARENILRITGPSRLSGTSANDLDFSGTVTAGARMSGVPAGVGVRLGGHRGDLAAAGRPIGRILDLSEGGNVATAAIGARPLRWLGLGGGLDVAGSELTPRLEVRTDARWLAVSYAHRVDRVPARLSTPRGLSTARPTPALDSQVDLGAPSDLVRAEWTLGRAGMSGGADLSRPGTWDVEAFVRPVAALALRAEHQAIAFRATPVASVGDTAVAGLVLGARADRWQVGTDWTPRRGHLIRAAYSEGHVGLTSDASDFGRQSARALLGADVDLALFFEQRADLSFRQIAVGYRRAPVRILGFAAGAQALRLRAGPGAIRYGSHLTDALVAEDQFGTATLDALALTLGVAVQLRGITIRAAAAQLVPLRTAADASSADILGGSGHRRDALSGSSGGSIWDRVGTVLGRAGGSVQVLEVGGVL